MLSLATSVGNLLKDFGEDDTDWLGKPVESSPARADPERRYQRSPGARIIDVPADLVAAKAKVSKAKVAKASDLDEETTFWHAPVVRLPA